MSGFGSIVLALLDNRIDTGGNGSTLCSPTKARNGQTVGTNSAPLQKHAMADRRGEHCSPAITHQYQRLKQPLYFDHPRASKTDSYKAREEDYPCQAQTAGRSFCACRSEPLPPRGRCSDARRFRRRQGHRVTRRLGRRILSRSSSHRPQSRNIRHSPRSNRSSRNGNSRNVTPRSRRAGLICITPAPANRRAITPPTAGRSLRSGVRPHRPSPNLSPGGGMPPGMAATAIIQGRAVANRAPSAGATRRLLRRQIAAARSRRLRNSQKERRPTRAWVRCKTSSAC